MIPFSQRLLFHIYPDPFPPCKIINFVQLVLSFLGTKLQLFLGSTPTPAHPPSCIIQLHTHAHWQLAHSGAFDCKSIPRIGGISVKWHMSAPCMEEGALLFSLRHSLFSPILAWGGRRWEILHPLPFSSCSSFSSSPPFFSFPVSSCLLFLLSPPPSTTLLFHPLPLSARWSYNPGRIIYIYIYIGSGIELNATHCPAQSDRTILREGADRERERERKILGRVE